MSKKKRFFIALFSGIILLFFWLGFWFYNPNIFSWTTWSIYKWLMLVIPRIAIPVLYFVILYILFSRNRELARNLSLLLLTFLICSVMAMPVIYLINSRSASKRIQTQYHSFLQLKPGNPESMDMPHGRNSIRIFCLGGSTTEFTDSRGRGWTDRLEKKLRELYHNDSIFVYNCGKQWYTSLHSLINYETNIRPLKPDIILFMHNVNDFIQNADFSYLSIGPFRKDYGHFVGPVADIIPTRHTGFLGRSMIKFRNIWFYNIPRREIIEQDSFPGLEAYDRNINTLIDLAGLDSTRVVLMTQPNIYSDSMSEDLYRVCVTVNYEGVGEDKMWSYRTGYRGMSQYNNKVRTIAEKRHTFLIDLEQKIPKSLFYFHDEVHYTDTAFVMVSKSIAEELFRQKVLKTE